MKPRRRASGFTLTELLVVITIIAVLAAVAVPALTGDSEEERFERFVSQFTQDIQRAHTEAIASREARSLVLASGRYQMNIIVAGTPSPLDLREATAAVWIAGMIKASAMPGNSYSAPSKGSKLSGTAELRFYGTGEMGVNVGSGLENAAATVFFQSESAKYLARIVVFPATSFAIRYDSW